MIGLALWLFCMLFIASKALEIEHQKMEIFRYFKNNVVKYGTNI